MIFTHETADRGNFTCTIGGKQSFDFVPSFTVAQFPVELLNRGLWSWLEAWREVYDVILIDCPRVRSRKEVP